MKIVHVNSIKGGGSIACNRLSEALNLSGVTSQTFNMYSLSMIDTKRVWLNLLIEKIFFSGYQESKKARFKFTIPFWGIDITKYDEVKNADIIHLHWIYNGFLSLRSFKQLAKLNKPIVWTLHDMGAFTGGCFYSNDCDHYKNSCGNCFYLKKPAENDISSKIYALKKKIYNGMNIHIVTCSNWLGNLAKESSLFEMLDVRAIPNPINIEIFKPSHSGDIRKNLKLPENKFLILFVAANIADERKGMNYLIDAIVKLCQKYPEIKGNIELLIIGDVKNASFDFPCNYSLTGFIAGEAAMCNYYSAADMFVSPSLDDNLPNTVMESLSCGTPVLAFNTGGIPDMVEHKKNGYLSNYKSADDLMNGIYWIYENRLNTELKTNARNKVLTNYNYSIVAEKYIQLYKKMNTVSKATK